MNIKILTNLLLIFLLPCEFLISYTNFVGLSIFGTIRTTFIVLLLVILFVDSIGKRSIFNFSTEYRGFLLIYFLYVGFVLKDILVYPKMSFESMLGVSPKYYQDTLIISVSLLLVNLFNKYVNYIFIGKVWILINSFFAIIYLSQINYQLYFLSESSSFYKNLGMIHPFTLASAGAVSFLLNLVLKEKWSKSRIINNITKVSHLPFYRLSRIIKHCNILIDNLLTFRK